MAPRKKRPGLTPGQRIVKKGGAPKAKRPNTAAQKRMGGANTKGSKRKGW